MSTHKDTGSKPELAGLSKSADGDPYGAQSGMAYKQPSGGDGSKKPAEPTNTGNTTGSTRSGCSLLLHRLANCSKLVGTAVVYECPVETCMSCLSCCVSCESKEARRTCSETGMSCLICPIFTRETLCTDQHDGVDYECCKFGQI
jgi:hypothetical protein